MNESLAERTALEIMAGRLALYGRTPPYSDADIRLAIASGDEEFIAAYEGYLKLQKLKKTRESLPEPARDTAIYQPDAEVGF